MESPIGTDELSIRSDAEIPDAVTEGNCGDDQQRDGERNPTAWLSFANHGVLLFPHIVGDTYGITTKLSENSMGDVSLVDIEFTQPAIPDWRPPESVGMGNDQ